MSTQPLKYVFSCLFVQNSVVNEWITLADPIYLLRTLLTEVTETLFVTAEDSKIVISLLFFFVWQSVAFAKKEKKIGHPAAPFCYWKFDDNLKKKQLDLFYTIAITIRATIHQ